MYKRKMNMRYVHTNLIARDWKNLSRFYIDVFGCSPVYPERHLSGAWIDELTSIENVRVDGIHLRLPGYGENGPTLEIFQYAPASDPERLPFINGCGFGHIAFHVDSVEDVLTCLLSHGGSQLGKMIVKDYEGIGRLTAVYARDPEGNFIEIQNWKK
jgi:catechol 2,3-dioxygenase-like lactoylglutathione lyase family enzyme